MAPGFSRVLFRAWSSSSPDFGLRLHLREGTVVIVFGLRRRLRLRLREGAATGVVSVGIVFRVLACVVASTSGRGRRQHVVSGVVASVSGGEPARLSWMLFEPCVDADS